VDAKLYDGGSINRAVRPDNTVRHDVEIQVIQFQIDAARRREQFPAIPLERTSVTGLCGLCVLCGSSCRGSRRGAVEPR
jgi:peptidyl-prolyl cis-trans isomerase A (cyclophilin A)